MTRFDPGIRLFVDQPLQDGHQIALNGEQTHYLRNVMRLNIGATVQLFNGRDGEWQATLSEIGKKGGQARLERQTRPHQDDADLWLLFAPVKRNRTDFIVEKASELGVACIQPVFTRYTDTGRVNVVRMGVTAREAAEQCQRVTVPAIRDADRLDRILDRWPQDRRLLFCDESRKAEPIADRLSSAREDAGPWAILIGPEGGFAPDEADRLRAMPQVLTVGLGPRVLRADTAAVAALSCWQALIGDWHSNER